MNERDRTAGQDGERSKPAQGHSGESADRAADRVEDADMDSMDAEERQEVLVDEAVEETFPASDPIAPKRIT